MRKLIGLIIGFICVTTYSQNLVPNGDFEDYHTCPKTFIAKYQKVSDYLKEWFSANKSTPDYYNSCSPGSNHSAGVPKNWAGYSPAKSGKGYTGIITWKKGINEYREYLQVRLKEPLKQDSTYKIAFFYCFPDRFPYYSTSLGVYLSRRRIYGNTHYALTRYKPQVSIRDSVVPRVFNQWYKLEKNYKALGGERYITIGNFKNNANSYSKLVNDRVEPMSHHHNKCYFYIDQVSVSLVENPALFIFKDLIKLKKLEKDKEYVVLFDFDSEGIREHYFPKLDRIVAHMQAFPDRKIVITGHADDRGSEQYNMELSKKRADSISNYLTKGGIAKERIKTEAYGELLPVADEEDSSSRQLNRRAEIILR